MRIGLERREEERKQKEKKQKVAYRSGSADAE